MITEQNIIGLDITIEGTTDRTIVDLGSVRLEREGRSYILDIINSDTIVEDNKLLIGCYLESDQKVLKETFSEETEFDLKEIDLLSEDLIAKVWVEGEEDFKVSSMYLYVFANGSQRVISCEEA